MKAGRKSKLTFPNPYSDEQVKQIFEENPDGVDRLLMIALGITPPRINVHNPARRNKETDKRYGNVRARAKSTTGS